MGEVLCRAAKPSFADGRYQAGVWERVNRGIDRTTPLYTSANRPVHFAQGAEPIRGV